MNVGWVTNLLSVLTPCTPALVFHVGVIHLPHLDLENCWSHFASFHCCPSRVRPQRMAALWGWQEKTMLIEWGGFTHQLTTHIYTREQAVQSWSNKAVGEISCSCDAIMKVSRPSDIEIHGSFPFMDWDKMVVIFLLFPSSGALWKNVSFLAFAGKWIFVGLVCVENILALEEYTHSLLPLVRVNLFSWLLPNYGTCHVSFLFVLTCISACVLYHVKSMWSRRRWLNR